jgi:transcriptional regulator with XRE-family HTH domain
MDKPMELPELLRAFKKRLSLSNAEIASGLGLPVYVGRNGSLIAPTISRWLHGKDRPPPFLWRAIEHLEHEIKARP